MNEVHADTSTNLIQEKILICNGNMPKLIVNMHANYQVTHKAATKEDKLQTPRAWWEALDISGWRACNRGCALLWSHRCSVWPRTKSCTNPLSNPWCTGLRWRGICTRRMVGSDRSGATLACRWWARRGSWQRTVTWRSRWGWRGTGPPSLGPADSWEPRRLPHVPHPAAARSAGADSRVENEGTASSAGSWPGVGTMSVDGEEPYCGLENLADMNPSWFCLREVSSQQTLLPSRYQYV